MFINGFESSNFTTRAFPFSNFLRSKKIRLPKGAKYWEYFARPSEIFRRMRNILKVYSPCKEGANRDINLNEIRNVMTILNLCPNSLFLMEIAGPH